MARNRQSKGNKWNVRPVSLTNQLIGLLQLVLSEVAGSNDYWHRPDHLSGLLPAQPPLCNDDSLDFRDYKIRRDEDIVPGEENLVLKTSVDDGGVQHRGIHQQDMRSGGHGS